MRTQPPSNQAGDQQNSIMADKSYAFEYGQVISRPMHYGGNVTLAQHFFSCLDADTAAMITLLAKTISFPEWEKKDTHIKDTHVWFQAGSNDVCVTQTPDGWLANGPNDQTLTYRRYLIPLFIPDCKDGSGGRGTLPPEAAPRLRLDEEDHSPSPDAKCGPRGRVGLDWLASGTSRIRLA